MREALFNIVKHAGTSQAEIDISHNDREIQIVISNDGKDFSAETLFDGSRGAGGWDNIRSRMQLVGCNIHIESEQEKGTRVTIHVPAQQVIY